ncbi:interleukin-6-like [Scyliorhinus canicula]|uniref:interleukin-6-like n=1 Tax=Scyliorhinus canicula TaxID=7830 RepID=UPI0018F40474|nr:interleukin-6-like [Scyliorhinus canicula]
MSPLAVSPLPESSGDSEDFSGPSAELRDLNLEPLALFIRNVAVELRNRQLCDIFSLCDGKMSSLQMYNMQLPQLGKRDRCFSRAFQKKKCLAKVVKSLDEYKKHLLSVKQWIQDEKQQAELLLVSMKNLADLLILQNKIQESITNQHKEAFIPGNPPKSVWDKQLKIHVILRNLALFMESTVRAIRFMN